MVLGIAVVMIEFCMALGRALDITELLLVIEFEEELSVMTVDTVDELEGWFVMVVATDDGWFEFIEDGSEVTVDAGPPPVADCTSVDIAANDGNDIDAVEEGSVIEDTIILELGKD